MSRKWLWLTFGVVGFVALVYIAAVCSGPVPEQGSAMPDSPKMPAGIVEQAPEQLTYRERKAQGLLTDEELQADLALQKIEADIAAGEVAYREYKPPAVQSGQQVSIPSVEGSASDLSGQDLLAMRRALIDRRISSGDPRELMGLSRDDMRRWRYSRGLPTQDPSWWEKAIGYMDGDPW